MTILVLAEHDHRSLASSTLSTIAAARQIGGEVHVLVAGHDCAAVASAVSTLSGVARVLLAECSSLSPLLAEDIAALIQGLCHRGYSHILAPATSFGKNILPRLSGLLDVSQISDVIEILDPATFRRPVYAGNAVATVRSSESVKLLTIRTTAFEGVATGEGPAAPVESVACSGKTDKVRFAGRETTKTERPELGSARVVVAGGRGLGSAENFKLIETLADKLGGAVGASRAAVDAGYAPNDAQVGQTGKIVAPQLYVAVGISGAIQHVAGMKESKIIVAINKDSEAPIFQIADYGLVADLFTALPELTAKL